MAKKLLTLLLCTTLCASLIACGAKEETETVAEPQEEVVEEAEEPETEVEEVVEEVEEEPATQESLMGFNMIENSDFSAGVGDWMTYFEKGYGALSVNGDGQLEMAIQLLGEQEHSVQVYYDGFGLEKGCVYEMSFDAAATAPREVQYRIQINGGDYHPYSSETLVLNEEMQHFTIQFTMEEASDPAPRLCFNMGLYGNTDADIAQHSVLLDNVELYCIDESGHEGGAAAAEAVDVQINQIGYLPADTKTVVFRGDAIGDSFTVVDAASGKEVFEGKMNAAADNANTGEKEATGDFSSLKEEGTYMVIGANDKASYEFTIGEAVYDEAFNETVKMLYMQRCGVALDATYAGDFSHEVCHNTKATIYGTNTSLDVSGGWHDAGDYGRYVVSGAKTVADILLAYEKSPEVFGDDTGIPESGNGTPDILDEARYELEWMMKMQDSASGGVYHKVTCTNFPGIVMPEGETEELIVAPISNCATGDFAASMAMAARVYEKEDPAFAKECLAAAEKAIAYLEANPNNNGGFKNPTEIVTGEYPDGDDTDERFWAYAELFKTTGDSKYEKKVTVFSNIPTGLGWEKMGYFGCYAYLTSDYSDKGFAKKVTEAMENECKNLVSNADAYGCTITEYNWGSNMSVANNGMLLVMMDEILGKDTYNDLAKAQMDYLFGNNTNSYCFLTGFGTMSPTGTHHRPSQFLKQTMPGMLVGGPNANLEDPYAQAVLVGLPKAKCYVDNEQSYSCNEITVYWNSPLIYLMSEYQ